MCSSDVNVTSHELAEQFCAAKTVEGKQRVIAQGLSMPNLNEFIELHKEGWLGAEGKFARVLARVLQAI